jgi:hypothetical protein
VTVIGTIWGVGCAPSAIGITAAGQKPWHDSAHSLVQKLREHPLPVSVLREQLGSPDAVVNGGDFATGNEQLDRHRSYVLRLSSGDVNRLREPQWKASTIFLYDEKSRYPWPVIGRWRSYLFEVKDGNVTAGWDTYPAWIPWNDKFWDDVRERINQEAP